MPSRPDIPLILLVLGSVLVIVTNLVYPSAHYPGLLLWSFYGISVSIYLYAVYWGLVVRRGMAVRLYRNQALGITLVSLGLLSLGIVVNSPILTSNTDYYVTDDLAGLLVFYWVDASMQASQDMDPLSRDSLHWSTLRYFLWGLYFAGVGVLAGFLALIGNGYFDNPPPGLTSNIIQFFANIPPFVALVAGIVALPIGTLRSRDRSFRRHLQWFALGLLLLFGFGLSFLYVPNNPTIVTIFYGEGLLVTGYCLYRSTRALVPLSRISSD